MTRATPPRQLFSALLVFVIAASCSTGPGTSPNVEQDTSVTVTHQSSSAVSSQPETDLSAAPSTSVDASLFQRPEWASHFAEAGVEGTFVLREAGSGTTSVFNFDRAQELRSPASTFKIFNALVLLQTGTVQSVDEVFEWDGIERSIPAWNQDHSLRSGMEVSAVWLFQLLARQVGETEMSRWLSEASYGNAETGGTSDQFWLDGSLLISPIGQVDFLESLLFDELPFRSSVVQDVQEILVREAGDGWTWSYKTGTASNPDGPSLGWLIGATQNEGRTWLFAMNVDLGSTIDPAVREDIARAVLIQSGALPPR